MKKKDKKEERHFPRGEFFIDKDGKAVYLDDTLPAEFQNPEGFSEPKFDIDFEKLKAMEQLKYESLRRSDSIKVSETLSDISKRMRDFEQFRHFAEKEILRLAAELKAIKDYKWGMQIGHNKSTHPWNNFLFKLMIKE